MKRSVPVPVESETQVELGNIVVHSQRQGQHHQTSSFIQNGPGVYYIARKRYGIESTDG